MAHHSAWTVRKSDKGFLCLHPYDFLCRSNQRRCGKQIHHAGQWQLKGWVPIRTKAKLNAAATNHIAFLQTNPERVKSYFQDPCVKYAARKLLPTGSIARLARHPIYTIFSFRLAHETKIVNRLILLPPRHRVPASLRAPSAPWFRYFVRRS